MLGSAYNDTRKDDLAMRVETYYNLHKKCLSYRPSGGTVRHAHTILLNNVTFSVQPAGREKVLREKKKNVHAFVRGELVFVDHPYIEALIDGCHRVTYNPYKYESFVDFNGTPVYAAQQVAIIGREIWMTE